jgi:methionyl-tRNA formyltransferase
VEATCGEETALRLDFVQLEGRKRITAREFANGARLAPGERFGS